MVMRMCPMRSSYWHHFDRNAIFNFLNSFEWNIIRHNTISDACQVALFAVLIHCGEFTLFSHLLLHEREKMVIYFKWTAETRQNIKWMKNVSLVLFVVFFIVILEFINWEPKSYDIRRVNIYICICAAALNSGKFSGLYFIIDNFTVSIYLYI